MISKISASLKLDFSKAEKEAMDNHVHEIRDFMATGSDPTCFLKCETCWRMFCPYCIGMCHDEKCRSLECVECKGNELLFSKCDWHD